MEPLEIVCESCESRMKLSEPLLEKIRGKSGRVTCRECGSKIMLDATQGAVRVTKGGRRAVALEIEEIEDFTEAPPSVEPHFSVAAALEVAPNLKEFEAPVPDFRSAGSLSPHTLYDEDDDGLVPLGREFNSSPFTSERDRSYNSLFAEPGKKPAPADVEAPRRVFSALSPPRRGEHRPSKSEPSVLKDDISTAPAVAGTIVEMAPDGQLINQTDRKKRPADSTRPRTWVPWTVAAIALLGLGVSVSLNRGAPASAKSQDAVTSVPATDSRALDEAARSEEPASAVVETQKEPSDETAAPPSIAADLGSDDSSGPTLAAQAAPAALSAGGGEPKPAAGSNPAAQPSAAQSTAARSSDAIPPEAGTATEETADTGLTKEEEGEEPALLPFSSSAALTALRDATALAGGCRKAGDPSGIARVVVTFAPSGRVTSAAVTGAPFAGTETGGCIASRFRTARVPAFAGEYVTVKKTVTIQ